jgi:hypothetical protein
VKKVNEEKIDLNKLSFQELEKTTNVVRTKEKGWVIGNNYLIRTVTHIQVGRLVDVNDKEVLLENASWVADTGRFSNMLKNGLESESSSEIESFGDGLVLVGRGAIVDVVEYKHSLPSKQK